MSISAPPTNKSDEKKVLDVINKGGKTAKPSKPNNRAYKCININLFNEELIEINKLRELRPRSRRGIKLGISLHDWIVEAILEKIERDKIG